MLLSNLFKLHGILPSEVLSQEPVWLYNMMFGLDDDSKSKTREVDIEESGF